MQKKPNGRGKTSLTAPSSERSEVEWRQKVARLEAAVLRLRIENEILLEGAALIREVAVNGKPAINCSSNLCKTIFKVMRSPEEMQKEIDMRLADSRRTWWSDFGKEKFPG